MKKQKTYNTYTVSDLESDIVITPRNKFQGFQRACAHKDANPRLNLSLHANFYGFNKGYGPIQDLKVKLSL